MVDSSLFTGEDDHIMPHEPYSQSILGNEFMFQQTLAYHQGSVRCLATLDSGYLMSGSIDMTNKLFVLNNATGKYEFDKEINYHTSYVNSLCRSVTGDGFFSGGKDTKMFKIDLMGNPVQLYEGHESTVNSISQSFPEEVVSGSWDGTAKIWDVETGKVKQTLEGHSHAVSVLTLENGIIITGSQDKKIRIWFKGNLEREFVAHGDIIRDFVEMPGIGFASCSNDETVKLWTIDGQNINTLSGHSGFVFSLTNLDSGELVSAGDDRTVRVWRDTNCVQVINHPRTIWSVTKNHLGDIITGSEDKKIRTFTRDPVRKDEGEGLKDYQNECTAQEMGEQLDMSKLPSIEQMRSMRNVKEGDVKIFKNGSQAEAYCYKGGRWEKIGDVMNPHSGATTGAKIYEGDRLFPQGEYDHIFDVDLGDGIMRKLPFDNGSNPLEAADKFILREGLHKAYVEQISNFIKNQSIPYVTSDNAAKKGLAAGTQASQFGQQATSAQSLPSKPSILPMKKMLFFDAINVDGPKKKLLEFNQELNILNEQELTLLDSLLELIKNKAFYHSSKVSKQGFDLIKKMLTKFPSEKVFPILDIYRMFLMHPQSSEHYKVFETGLEYMGIILGHLRDEKGGQPTQLVGLRCLVNLFNNNASVYMLNSKRQYIIDNTCHFVMSDNKNLRQAAITLLLNYSILFVDKNDPEGRIQLISALSEVFNKENDAQNYLRLVTAIGNLSVGDADAKEMIMAMGININTSKLEASDPKTVETINEIKNELGL